MSARVFVFVLAFGSCLWADGVTVQFAPDKPDVGPFPTDFLTVPDAAQKTGLRVNLPLPDCTSHATDCKEISLLNQLDGFDMMPRVRVRFSGPIDEQTLRGGVMIEFLGNLTNDEYGLQRDGSIAVINQVIFDPATNSAYAKPDEFFDQHRRYLLFVTDAVRDKGGAHVGADPAFTACINGGTPTIYCAKLAQAVKAVEPSLAPEHIVGASLFTTLSVTDWMRKARMDLQSAPVGTQPSGTKSLFNVSDIASITVNVQATTDPAKLTSVPLPLAAFDGVGQLAFGSYQSPQYIGPELFIPQTPTGAPIGAPVKTNAIQFHVFLPATAMPATGYPVAIFGHGLTDSAYGAPTAMAATLAHAGIATIAINVFGHGFGPASVVSIVDRTGTTIQIPEGGRGLPIRGDGSIGSSDGCILPTILGVRDCLRQTVVDIMQLIRNITIGIDLNGDGHADLDPAKIYYVGQSFGAIYGTMLSAIEPDIVASVLNSGGGTITDISRNSPDFRPAAVLVLGNRTPSLLNKGADFSDNYVLRYLPARVNTVPGAMDVQEVFERADWLDMPGDPIGFAPHLRSSTLPGVPLRNILFQYPKGDRTVPNPEETNLVRAANMREQTRYFRWDLARAIFPSLPANPHTFLTNFDTPQATFISLLVQQQAAGFLLSGGTSIPDVNPQLSALFPTNLFDMPSFLTEDLNF